MTCKACGGTRRIQIAAGTTHAAYERDCPTCVGWPVPGTSVALLYRPYDPSEPAAATALDAATLAVRAVLDQCWLDRAPADARAVAEAALAAAKSSEEPTPQSEAKPSASALAPDEQPISSLPTDDVGELIERLKARAMAARQSLEQSASAEDGDWLSAMPPEVSESMSSDAALDEQAASTLSRLRGERDEADEMYEIGKRDGYEAAIQDVDLLTGGDGEYRFCTDLDPERHTPDAATMKARIAERFQASEAARLKAEDLNRKLVEGLRGLEHAVIDARQILQKASEEWREAGEWSDWDATTIEKLSAAQINAVALLSSISGGEAAGEDGP